MDLPQQTEAPGIHELATLRSEIARLQDLVTKLIPAPTPPGLEGRLHHEVQFVRATRTSNWGSGAGPRAASKEAIDEVGVGVNELIAAGFVCDGELQVNVASVGGSGGVYILVTVVQKMLKIE